jgi:hypothetical protein
MVAGDDTLVSDFYILHGLWSIIWEHRRLQDLVMLAREHDPEAESSSPDRGKKLAKILTQMSSRIATLAGDAPGVRLSEVIFILEFLSMTLHVPLYCLQSFAGKDGAKEAQRVCHLLREWAPTKEARQAMWHGGQLIRAAKELYAEQMRDSKVVLIYHTSLAFWAYGIINVARRKRDGRTTPALSEVPQLSRTPFIPLDGQFTSDVRKFISLDEGTPYISDTSWQGDAVADEKKFKVLLKPSDTIGVAICVLRRQKQGQERSYPPLVESLTRLMSGIGKAAHVLGM